MFDMTVEQKQAFKDAAGGVSASGFSHLILFLIGLLATVWLLMVLVGLWKEMKQQKTDVGEFFGKFLFAVFVYIMVGALIFF